MIAEIPAPAPGADRHLALDFANSLLTLPSGSVDLLGTPQSAAAWLRERDLVPPETRLYEFCAGKLRQLRVHIRTLLDAATSGARPDHAALDAVNAAMTLTPAAAILRWDAGQGLHRAAAHPIDQAVDHALAVLAADAADLLTGPGADRLAACGSPPCGRYLVRTHAARHWCSTRCGDRARAARAYARKQPAT